MKRSPQLPLNTFYSLPHVTNLDNNMVVVTSQPTTTPTASRSDKEVANPDAALAISINAAGGTREAILFIG